MKQLLQRMDALEQENRQLKDEIHGLRDDINAAAAKDHTAAAAAAPGNQEPSLPERVEVNERRISEQAQTKVEASQKFPVSLNGVLLFNAFTNSQSQGNESVGQDPLLAGPGRSGATVRQTIVGLQFQGPALPGDGHVDGSLTMDFFGGSSAPGSSWLRLRQADISLDWADRTVTIGQEKPLISPYAPDSLAEVGVPPLAGAGNLWLWLPQARYEERFHLGTKAGITTQVALMQTEENYNSVSSQYTVSLQPARPAVEARVAYWRKSDDTRRIEIGSGFHASTTRVAGNSVASRIASLDWRATPFGKLEFSGTMYTGQNVAGLGSLGNGFTITEYGTVHPVHSAGIWSQIAVPITNRLTVNFFAGLESDRATYASSASIVRNLTYAANAMYHIGPNVVIALEGLQQRARYFSGAMEIDNHYDLALGYFF
jgi:hypothetical protein